MVDLVVGTADSVGIDGINSCTNGLGVLNPDFTTWGSDSVAVAKAPYALVQGMHWDAALTSFAPVL